MTHRRESPARGVNDASEDLLHRRHDMLDGETEILEQHAARRGLAEAVDADDGAAAGVDRTHVVAPEIGDARLDRYARHTTEKHAFAPGRFLPLEHAGTVHGHRTHGESSARLTL